MRSCVHCLPRAKGCKQSLQLSIYVSMMQNATHSEQQAADDNSSGVAQLASMATESRKRSEVPNRAGRRLPDPCSGRGSLASGTPDRRSDWTSDSSAGHGRASARQPQREGTTGRRQINDTRGVVGRGGRTPRRGHGRAREVGAFVEPTVAATATGQVVPSDVAPSKPFTGRSQSHAQAAALTMEPAAVSAEASRHSVLLRASSAQRRHADIDEVPEWLSKLVQAGGEELLNKSAVERNTAAISSQLRAAHARGPSARLSGTPRTVPGVRDRLRRKAANTESFGG